MIMALPDFGLMTKADKLKLDGIDTTTLLTKTEAAATYATKAEVREYIRQVVESDTGFVLINGNDSEVGLIPVFQAPYLHLTVSLQGSTYTDADNFSGIDEAGLWYGETMTLTIDTNASETPILTGASENTSSPQIIPVTFTNNSCNITNEELKSAGIIYKNQLETPVEFTLSVGELSQTFTVLVDDQPT